MVFLIFFNVCIVEENGLLVGGIRFEGNRGVIGKDCFFCGKFFRLAYYFKVYLRVYIGEGGSFWGGKGIGG